VTNLRSLAHRGGHRRPVMAFSLRCSTAVACSRGRIRRSLRTPVRHAASGQMVGVDGATARSAAVRPIAVRGTVCGHGVRGRVIGSVVPVMSDGRAGRFRSPRQSGSHVILAGGSGDLKVQLSKSARRCNCAMHSECAVLRLCRLCVGPRRMLLTPAGRIASIDPAMPVRRRFAQAVHRPVQLSRQRAKSSSASPSLPAAGPSSVAL